MKKKIIIFSLLVLLLDQVSKALVLNYLGVNNIFIIINNFFSLNLVFNTGASWSILNDSTLLLIILSIIMLGIILGCLFRAKETIINLWAFTLLIGGLFGNLIDRIFRGSVVDFLSFNIFGYHFPVFNIADIAIVIGTVLIAISIFKGDL